MDQLDSFYRITTQNSKHKHLKNQTVIQISTSNFYLRGPEK